MMEAVVEATLANLDTLLSTFCADGRDFRTIYVGGGTPTALGPALLGRLLRGLRDRAGASVEEWTVEANPESLDARSLDAMLESGVNRVSLGLQRMDDAELALLGRLSTSRRNEEAVLLLAGAPVRRSADFIAAIPRRPGQAAPDPGALARAVAFVADSGFSHISVYDLTPEEGTPLAQALERGILLAAAADDDDADADSDDDNRDGQGASGETEHSDRERLERDLMERELAGRGFARYEISNYSLPGQESAHNGAYWALRSYLGAGSGAVSTLRAAEAGEAPGRRGCALRIEQVRDLDAFIAGTPGRETIISPRDSAFETIMMGIRTTRGVDRSDFRARFGYACDELIGGTLSAWSGHVAPGTGGGAGTGDGAGTGGGDFLALDPEGMVLANRFLVDCLAEMESSYPRVAKEGT